MSDLLKAIAENVIQGRSDKQSPLVKDMAGAPGVKELTERAIKEGMDVEDIINKGLLAGMDVVGKRFKNDEIFIPEVLISAEALGVGMELLKPLIVESGLKPTSKVVIGTVKGDLHDIGKNLVSMMLQGAQFEVIDLGVDISTDSFIDSIKKEKPKILGLSCLLTSSMHEMKTVIDAVKKENLQNQVKIMVGGAPVTQDYASRIGADGFAEDAVIAVDRVKELIK
ncbi:MAG: corrinoid protein [Spirochaetota bacterium]|nr:MAG: corrinoid protein [Spirochaetota bacterium]